MSIINIVQLLGGFVLLLGGGEILVRGSVSLAKRLQISPFFISATVIAFGTSVPELVISLKASLNDAMGIVVGNVVGSNIANLLLILGIAGLITPVLANKKVILRDNITLLSSTLILCIFIWLEEISRWQGGIMFFILILLLTYSYWSEKRHGKLAKGQAENTVVDIAGAYSSFTSSMLILCGLAGVAIGAHLLVESAIVVARGIGMTEAVIGLTVVAVGSSLPELATAIVAAYRKHADVALGNVIGSSLFNILGILGLVAIVNPITVPSEIAEFDVWVLLVATSIIFLLVLTGTRIYRFIGGLFLVSYVIFVVLQYLGFIKP